MNFECTDFISNSVLLRIDTIFNDFFLLSIVSHNDRDFKMQTKIYRFILVKYTSTTAYILSMLKTLAKIKAKEKKTNKNNHSPFQRHVTGYQNVYSPLRESKGENLRKQTHTV